MKHQKIAAAFAWIAVLLSLPAAGQAEENEPAAAAVSASAREHFLRGVAAYKSGSLDAALAEFNKAYETRPDYRVLYNIGQVQVERHDHVAALQAFRRYLKDGGGDIAPERRQAVEALMRDSATRVATLSVTANVDAGEILVDGGLAGTLPTTAPLEINAGIREITIRSEGRTATPRRITAAGGDVVQLEFVLTRDAPAAGRQLAAAAPASRPAEPRPRASHTKIGVAVAAAVVFAGGAVAFGLLARRSKQTFEDDLGQFPGDRARIDSDRSQLRLYAGLTDGLAAAAVCAAGAGLYFALSGAGEAEAPREARAGLSSLRASVGPSGLTLTGAF